MAAEEQIKKPSPSRPLLFINKDATSLNRTPAEAFAIGSHVSKSHRNWLKCERLRRMKPSASRRTHNAVVLRTPGSDDHESSTQTERRVTQTLRHDSSDSNDSTPVSTSSSGSNVHGPNSDTSESSIDAASSGGNGPSCSTSSIPSALPKESTDHFPRRIMSSLLPIRCRDICSTAIRINPTDRELLNLARDFHVFPAWAVRASRLFREQLNSSYDDHLADAAKDEAVYHALLAVGSMVKSFESTKDRHRFIGKARSHKTQAVSILRQRLASKDDSAKVLPVIQLLLTLDFAAGDYGAGVRHLAAARHLSVTVGNPPITCTNVLFISDVWLAVTLLRHTDFSVFNWDPGSRSKQASATTTISVEARGLVTFSSSSNSSSSRLPDVLLHNTMEDVRELVEILNLLECFKDNCDTRYILVCWLYYRSNAILGHLVNRFVDITYSSCLSTTPGPKDPNSLLNVTISLGMVLFIGTLFSDTPFPVPCARVAATFGTKLRKLWARVLKGAAVVDDSLLLWLLFLYSYYNCTSPTTREPIYQEWAASALDFWCQELHIVEYEDLRSRLKGFLYVDAQMDSYLFEVMAGFDRYKGDFELEIGFWDET